MLNSIDYCYRLIYLYDSAICHICRIALFITLVYTKGFDMHHYLFLLLFLFFLDVLCRFGTVAVPNLMIFQGPNAVSRYNRSDADFDHVRQFVTSNMKIRMSDAVCKRAMAGFNEVEMLPGSSCMVTKEDLQGPLHTVHEESTDWLLCTCSIFLFCFVYEKLSAF